MLKHLPKIINKYKAFIAFSIVIVVLLSIPLIPRSLYAPQTSAAASSFGSHSDPNSLNSVIGQFSSSNSFGSNPFNSQPSPSDTINQFTGLSHQQPQPQSDPNSISNSGNNGLTQSQSNSGSTTGSGGISQSQAGTQTSDISSNGNGISNSGNNDLSQSQTNSGSATGPNGFNHSQGGIHQSQTGAQHSHVSTGGKYSNSGSLPGGSSFG